MNGTGASPLDFTDSSLTLHSAPGHPRQHYGVRRLLRGAGPAGRRLLRLHRRGPSSSSTPPAPAPRRSRLRRCLMVVLALPPLRVPQDKMAFLKKAHDKGIRNIEMESAAFAAFCLKAGVHGAVVCATLVVSGSVAHRWRAAGERHGGLKAGDGTRSTGRGRVGQRCTRPYHLPHAPTPCCRIALTSTSWRRPRRSSTHFRCGRKTSSCATSSATFFQPGGKG